MSILTRPILHSHGDCVKISNWNIRFKHQHQIHIHIHITHIQTIKAHITKKMISTWKSINWIATIISLSLEAITYAFVWLTTEKKTASTNNILLCEYGFSLQYSLRSTFPCINHFHCQPFFLFTFFLHLLWTFHLWFIFLTVPLWN